MRDCHEPLNGFGAADGPHHARVFGEHTVAGGVDDTPAMLGDYREYDTLKLLQRTDGALFVVTHQAAVAGNIGGKNSGQSSIHGWVRP